MSQTRWKIVEALWVDRSAFINGLNFILLMYGLAVILVEALAPIENPWFRFFRFYAITMIAMNFVKGKVNKLSKTPQRVDSSPPNSPSS